MTDNHLLLFPLSTVLFPGGYISLQVFESRYLRLVSHCLKHDLYFGIVTLREGSEVQRSKTDQVVYEPVGCTASIVDWTQCDNGLLAIVLRGEREFLVKDKFIEDDGLHCGAVEYRPQLADEPADDTVAPLYLVLHALLEHPSQRYMAADYEEEGSELSLTMLTNGLAQLVPASLDVRYRWLAEPDVQLRINAITRHLEVLQS